MKFVLHVGENVRSWRILVKISLHVKSSFYTHIETVQSKFLKFCTVLGWKSVCPASSELLLSPILVTCLPKTMVKKQI